MFSTIWHTFFFDPIYNALILFIEAVPGGDLGIAIILLTLLVKIVLLPLSLKAAETQFVMRTLEPKLAEIKEKYKDNREQLARSMMDAYKEAGVNPFASIFLIFLQIPIIIALYLSVFSGGGVKFPEINTELLYAFVAIPEVVNMMFLGLIDVAGRSLPLAALAGITQYIHTGMVMPKIEPLKEGVKPSFGDDFKRSMQLQMKYVMPLIIFFVAYTISAAIALYFLVSNIASIGQEYIVRNKRAKLESTDA